HTSELQSLTNLVCRLLLGDQTCARSEEHTSELQSLTNLVCRFLLEKKNPSMLLSWPGPWVPSPLPSPMSSRLYLYGWFKMEAGKVENNPALAGQEFFF